MSEDPIKFNFQPNFMIDKISEKIYVGKVILPDGRKEDFYITRKQYEEILEKLRNYIFYGDINFKPKEVKK